MQNDLKSDAESLENLDVLESGDKGQRSRCKEAFRYITVHFLREMGQEEMAIRLQRRKKVSLQNFLFKAFLFES